MKLCGLVEMFGYQNVNQWPVL